MARGGDMQEVELLEGDHGDDEVAGQPALPAQTRRRRWWIPAGAVAVALSLVSVQLVVDAREEAAAERLAAIPGVFPPLGDELVVLRTITQADGSSLWAGVGIDAGRTAGLVVAEDGSQSFAAVDQRTGETLWSTPLLGPNAERAASLQNSWGGSCQGDTPYGGSAVAVCLVTDGFVRYEDDGGEERVPATSSRVMVLDTGDGHVIAEWGTEATAQIVVLDGLAVVGTGEPGRGAAVVGHELRSGAERWRHEEPLDADGAQQLPGRFWGLVSAGAAVGIYDGDSITVLSSTGSVVRPDIPVSSDGAGFATDPVTGAFVISTNVGTTMLLAPDADPADDVEVRGELLRVAVDDGSLPDMVLTSRSHAYGSDRTSGEELWEADVQPSYGALVIRGRVYVTTTTEIVALEGRNGEVVWRTPLPAYGGGVLATDGRDLLLLSSQFDGSGDGTGGGVTVIDLATGEETRQVPYPEGVTDVQMLNGLLIGWSYATEEVVVLE